MTSYDQNEALLNIQQLIDKSRCGLDGFFTDSRVAAMNILKYLETENIIIKSEESFPMKYNETSKAASLKNMHIALFCNVGIPTKNRHYF